MFYFANIHLIHAVGAWYLARQSRVDNYSSSTPTLQTETGITGKRIHIIMTVA